ncbi:MAG: tripartite tricarboxylate transporter substrate binding protein [Casimicrobiaceae bacterium]
MNTLKICALALLLAAGAAHAQQWPSQPIKLIVPFPAGGGTDLVGRAIAKGMAEGLGQPVVVDNRGGAGGTIGSEIVARATPDGYTLGIATSSTHPTSVVLMKSVPYDPVKSFAPVTMIGKTAYVLIASPTLPATSMSEFVAYAKANPGTLNFASVGMSTLGYLITRQMLIDAGINMVHVPYKGSAEVYPALISGDVAIEFDNPSASAGMVKSGRLRVFGTTLKTSLMPTAPEFADIGYKNLDTTFWYGIVAPAGTPKAIVDRVQAAVAKYVASPEGRKVLDSAGIEPVGDTPEEFGAIIARDNARAQALADKLGIKPE